jgi:hypothetical protein
MRLILLREDELAFKKHVRKTKYLRFYALMPIPRIMTSLSRKIRFMLRIWKLKILKQPIALAPRKFVATRFRMSSIMESTGQELILPNGLKDSNFKGPSTE